jgi:hypothetical protein
MEKLPSVNHSQSSRTANRDKYQVLTLKIMIDGILLPIPLSVVRLQEKEHSSTDNTQAVRNNLNNQQTL